MSNTSQELAALFRRDIGKLRKEIASFPDGDSVWRILPGVVNPAGNLALHLEGNLRRYIGRQLGHVPYERNRALEFSTRNVPVRTIVSRIAEVEDLIPEVIESLTEPQLSERYPETVLESPMTVRHFLIHLHGHLLYHVGQINYLRRLLVPSPAISPRQMGSSIDPSR
jgi:hypothetical protein